MNKIILIGRLTYKPEKRIIDDKTLISFTLAVNRRFDHKAADFIPCEAWGTTAIFIENFFDKGDSIAILGELRTGSHVKDGQKQFSAKVIIDEAYFTGSSLKR